MDPQQELFSALLIALKEKYKNTGIDVYDTFCRRKERRIHLYISEQLRRRIRTRRTRSSEK